VYNPGTHVTIDEIMMAFRGRSEHTTKLPNKPIKEGYKNWVLDEHGYVWNWLWYSLVNSTEGAHEPQDVRILKDLPETRRMIMRLALQLPIQENDYILYLDNLFVSVPLAEALREASVGITGTTRKNSSGLPQWLLDLKHENKKLA